MSFLRKTEIFGIKNDTFWFFTVFSHHKIKKVAVYIQNYLIFSHALGFSARLVYDLISGHMIW